MQRLVSPRAAGLCVIAGVWAVLDLDLVGQLGEIGGCRALCLLGRPAEEKGAIRLVQEDLKCPGHVARLRDAVEQPLVEQLRFLVVHGTRAAPVCPAGLHVLVVVVGREVHDRVDETKDEAFRCPVDDEVHGHVV